ncbi:MAG: hypothetical protein NXI31_15630 [bacterium]|nr:hypothetical protein [bacterium]
MLNAPPRTLASIMLFVVLGSCCTPPTPKGLLEEVIGTRGSEVGSGGAISVPGFAEPRTVESLQDGATKAEILELVGPPWRKLPANTGELWLWEMAIFERHMLLALNVVDGRQRGHAVQEWRTIPAFLLHHALLEPGLPSKEVVDRLGSPTRWDLAAGRAHAIWEAAVQLERQDGEWRYSPDVQLHSLRLEFVADELLAAPAIQSRKVSDWNSAASQRAAGM